MWCAKISECVAVFTFRRSLFSKDPMHGSDIDVRKLKRSFPAFNYLKRDEKSNDLTVHFSKVIFSKDPMTVRLTKKGMTCSLFVEKL